MKPTPPRRKRRAPRKTAPSERTAARHDGDQPTKGHTTVHATEGATELPAVAQLSLLGGFELTLDGESVELPHSAQRLISFLALRRRALMRVFVAGTLWSDASEA